MGKLIYNVQEIFEIHLEDEFTSYNIPEYQRGYKWSDHQIIQLLEDINCFKTNDTDDKFYCLQNITIVPNKKGGYYNVVDGQQRLTTLVLLLSFLGKSDLVAEKLRYSIREDTNQFIKKYILTRKITETNWNEFLENRKEDDPNTDYDHQDVYYLFTAYNVISMWFDKNKDAKFIDKLLNKVKLIVNKIDVPDEQILFTNLNSGKVSLDGADLIRAILITNVAKNGEDDNDTLNIKEIIQISEKRIKIGAELDQITSWWNQQNVISYFSDILKTINSSERETINFDVSKHPVNLLYKLYFVTQSDSKEKSISINFFEQVKPLILYDDILKLHRIIVDWFSDTKIYHFIKFLHSQCDIDIVEIYNNMWLKVNKKQEFILMLRNRIYHEISNSIENISIHKNTQENKILCNTNWYDGNESSELYKFLILLDIIQIVNSSESNNPLPRLLPIFFSPNKEDREHIFPQTPISQKDITKPDKDKIKNKVEKYLEILQDEKIKIPDTDNFDYGNSEQLIVLKNKIQQELLKVIHINSIGNMCLLHQKINRGYGNDFYTLKRCSILNNIKDGQFIRPHTLTVFDKNFNDEEESKMHRWTNEDIIANVEYIKRQILAFFELSKDNDEK